MIITLFICYLFKASFIVGTFATNEITTAAIKKYIVPIFLNNLIKH